MNPKLEICKQCGHYNVFSCLATGTCHRCELRYEELVAHTDFGIIIRSSFRIENYDDQPPIEGQLFKKKRKPWRIYAKGAYGIPKGCPYELEQVLANHA